MSAKRLLLIGSDLDIPTLTGSILRVLAGHSVAILGIEINLIGLEPGSDSNGADSGIERGFLQTGNNLFIWSTVATFYNRVSLLLCKQSAV